MIGIIRRDLNIPKRCVIDRKWHNQLCVCSGVVEIKSRCMYVLLVHPSDQDHRECECVCYDLWTDMNTYTSTSLFHQNKPVEGGPDNWQLGRGEKQGRHIIGGSSPQSCHF